MTCGTLVVLLVASGSGRVVDRDCGVPTPGPVQVQTVLACDLKWNTLLTQQLALAYRDPSSQAYTERGISFHDNRTEMSDSGFLCFCSHLLSSPSYPIMINIRSVITRAMHLVLHRYSIDLIWTDSCLELLCNDRIRRTNSHDHDPLLLDGLHSSCLYS